VDVVSPPRSHREDHFEISCTTSCTLSPPSPPTPHDFNSSPVHIIHTLDNSQIVHRQGISWASQRDGNPVKVRDAQSTTLIDARARATVRGWFWEVTPNTVHRDRSYSSSESSSHFDKTTTRTPTLLPHALSLTTPTPHETGDTWHGKRSPLIPRYKTGENLWIQDWGQTASDGPHTSIRGGALQVGAVQRR
jgi:hypothetical protein